MRQGLLAILIVALLLPGCGWRLRGAGVDLTGLSIQLQVNRDRVEPEFIDALTRSLRSSGVELVDDPDAAEGRLEISNVARGRRVTTVDARARANEYEVSYNVSFRVFDAEGEPLTVPQTYQASASYAYDREDVLGSRSREDRLVENLRETQARRVVARLSLLRAQ